MDEYYVINMYIAYVFNVGILSMYGACTEYVQSMYGAEGIFRAVRSEGEP